VLKRIGPAAAGPAVPELAKLLAQKHSRVDALELLQDIGPAASSAVPAVVAMIDAGEMPDEVAPTLRRIARGDPRVAQALLRVAQRNDPETRHRALRILDDMQGIPSAESIPTLIAALDQDNEREFAQGALTRAGAVACEKVCQLRTHRLVRTRRIAVNILAGWVEHKTQACEAQATDALIDFLADPDESVAQLARNSLIAANNSVLSPLLKDKLDSPFPQVRAWALERMTYGLNAAALALARLGDPDEIVRVTAVKVLAANIDDLPAAVPSLVDRLQHDPSPSVRKQIALAFARYPRQPVDAALQAATRDADSDVALAASDAMLRRARLNSPPPQARTQGEAQARARATAGVGTPPRWTVPLKAP
jgi:HEAT repeat protein